MGKTRFRLMILATVILAGMLAPSAFAQGNEIAVLVGRINASDQSIDSLAPIKTAFDGSLTYQFNYANRLLNGGIASLYWELAITGAPGADVKGASLLLPKNYSSLFLTPGLKLKLLPGAFISPYAVGGIGLARFKESDTLINGLPNPGDRANTTWAFDFGGGVDLNILPVFAIRGEVRDYLTGTPDFNVGFIDNKQHNISVAGGIVFKW